MNKEYTRYTINPENEAQKEILIAMLGDWGIEGFEEEQETLHASGPTAMVETGEIEAYLNGEQIGFEKTVLTDQNWNALWESNFQPVRVADFVGIRAEFHEPLEGVEHEILITPKMSFGTGHHATTCLVMLLMRELDFAGKEVLDFGTGTGILAILAEKKGAAKVWAVDNDDWSIDNARENVEKNGCHNIAVEKGEEPPAQYEFDIVLANINKHIILQYLEKISAGVRPGGQVILSGLLVADETGIRDLAKTVHLRFTKRLEKDGWIALFFQKTGNTY